MKKTIKGFANLEYLTLTNIPVRKTAYGEVLDVSMLELERLAAIAVLESRVPLRGLEVKLFRSVLGLSLAAFGQHLGYKDTTILSWEKGLKKRLSLVNEIAVKLLVAEYLGVDLPMSIEKLKGLDKSKPLKIKAA